jgi:hypothetical protein
MAEFIRLAEMPKGKAFKTLSKTERIYIDDNWQYENIERMAKVLRISYMDVDVYCRKMDYLPPKMVKAKPKQIPKSDTFDVDTYNPFSI